MTLAYFSGPPHPFLDEKGPSGLWSEQVLASRDSVFFLSGYARQLSTADYRSMAQRSKAMKPCARPMVRSPCWPGRLVEAWSGADLPLQPRLDPSQPLGVQGVAGAGDRDVGQHGVRAGHLGRLAVVA